ncbi:AAA family ATPase [bacterium]|nr:AAA family ATPase [bacterium]
MVMTRTGTTTICFTTSKRGAASARRRRRLLRDEAEDDDDSFIASEATDSSSTEDSEDEDDDQSRDGDSEEDEDDFALPRSLLRVDGVRETVEACKAHLATETPSVRDIVTTPLRTRDRARLLQLHAVFRETLPASQERLEMRELLHALWQRAKEEHRVYDRHATIIQQFEKDSSTHSLVALQARILDLETSNANKSVIYSKYLELCERDQQDEEYFKMKQWISWAIQLPFDRVTITDRPVEQHGALLQEVQRHLDKNLYGMKEVKEQILLFIHTKLLNPDVQGCCLGLVGDCGVGKTTVARCLAQVLHLPFQQISFGGLQHVDSLKGFDFTYVGSQPGEIVKSLIRMKAKNGVLFLDEFEKVAASPEMASFLLHLTDFSQNHEFRDNYFNELTIDLSRLWFIYSMNELPEDRALRDRVYSIKVPGYSERDKIQILIDYLLPKARVAHSLTADQLQLPFPSAVAMVRRLPSGEKGVRTLEQMVRVVVSKASFLLRHGSILQTSFACPVPADPTQPFLITLPVLEKLLQGWEKDRQHNGDGGNMFI